MDFQELFALLVETGVNPVLIIIGVIFVILAFEAPAILFSLISLKRSGPKKKELEEKESEELLIFIKEQIKEECKICSYRIEHIEGKLFQKEMYEAEEVIEELYKEMKSDFLTILKKHHGKDSDYFSLTPYIKFNDAWKYTKEALLVEIRKIYRENDIKSLNHDQIEKRTETRLYGLITKVFDDIYRDISKPNRVELFKETEIKKYEYLRILCDVYERAILVIDRYDAVGG